MKSKIPQALLMAATILASTPSVEAALIAPADVLASGTTGGSPITGATEGAWALGGRRN